MLPQKRLLLRVFMYLPYNSNMISVTSDRLRYETEAPDYSIR